jgi:2-polyprenyl-3-methyl-5-hydroxy-6-metoxy-1,4-benzoquinol methylase
MNKLQYFLDALKKNILNNENHCPSCGCKEYAVADRKYLVTSLRRCAQCRLLYRCPLTSTSENEKFYQQEYSQGFTTDIPTDEVLNKFLECNFKNTEKDYSDYINVLKALACKEGMSLFDFGCSWGYGSKQFQEFGFNVTSFEISKLRCDFAKNKLNINACSDLSEFDNVANSFDIFFSSHVLEHVPSVQNVIQFAWRVLKPGGLFVAFTPNGSNEFCVAYPDNWHKLWGMVHPNFLDKQFYESYFDNYILMSNPFSHNDLTNWVNSNIKNKTVLDLSNYELLCVVKKFKA